VAEYYPVIGVPCRVTVLIETNALPLSQTASSLTLPMCKCELNTMSTAAFLLGNTTKCHYDHFSDVLPDTNGVTLFSRHDSNINIRFDNIDTLLGAICLHVMFMSLGAEIRSVCTEAGMFAIRARRKMATEKDFLEAVNKVIKAYAKFSATPRYMTYN